MKGRLRFSLGNKIAVLILLMAIALSTSTIYLGYQWYCEALDNHNSQLGLNLANTAAIFLDGDSVGGYLQTGEKDEAYHETLELLKKLKASNGAEYMYVMRPEETGMVYAFDTDEGPRAFDLGDVDDWAESYLAIKDDLLAGNVIDYYESNDSFGWFLSVYVPVHDSTGGVAAYIGADFSMETFAANKQEFLLNLIVLTIIITLIFVVICIYFINVGVAVPVNAMAKAADEFLIEAPYSGGSRAQSKNIHGLEKLSINSNDEIGSLAVALKSMGHKINEYIYNLDVATKRAETDSLTGLDNRDAFQNRVTVSLRNDRIEGQVSAFMMIDIDNFKAINDTYGHVVGDEILQKVAAALKRIFRSSDLVARLGGDEFAVFCKSISSVEMVVEKAEQIIDKWHEILPEEGADCLTPSIGISIAPKDGLTYVDLYQNADEAMYLAKEQGKDRYVFYEVNTLL